MHDAEFFNPASLERLRRRAEPIANRFEFSPSGVHVDYTAAMQLLSLFRDLWLSDGFRLLTIVDSDGANAVGQTHAVPEDQVRWPLHGADVPDKLAPLTNALESKHSPRSFLQASLFLREAEELGAAWHGLSWSTHVLVGPMTDARGIPVPARRHPEVESDSGDWTWQVTPPTDWRPLVSWGGDGMTVRFYSRSDLGQARIVEHTDLYSSAGSLTPERNETVVATGSGGYIF